MIDIGPLFFIIQKKIYLRTFHDPINDINHVISPLKIIKSQTMYINKQFVKKKGSKFDYEPPCQVLYS